MFSSLFKRKPKVPEISIDTYATYPVFLMIEEKPPFNDWRDPESKIEPGFEEMFRVCVWMYQMYVYYVLTAKRFGYEIADKVLKLQVEQLSKASNELGEQLYLAIREIHRTVAEGVESPFTVPAEGKDFEVPVEYNVALEFLTVSEEAPFHVTKTEYEEKGIPDFREQDFALAACLEHGKAAALNEFLVLTREAKVTL